MNAFLQKFITMPSWETSMLSRRSLSNYQNRINLISLSSPNIKIQSSALSILRIAFTAPIVFAPVHCYISLETVWISILKLKILFRVVRLMVHLD